jgi:polyphenol oxidase
MSLPPFLTSKLLPVPHAFTTRQGGESAGPYASLNLGLSVGDDRGTVIRNLHKVATWLEVSPSEMHSVSQVHGDVVLEAANPAEKESLPAVSGEADALYTARSGAAVGVKTADCIPILLVNPRTRCVAAVHSGWKGTQKKIVQRAVEVFIRLGANPAEIFAAIGPSIRACCYEVSEELAAQFGAQFGASVVRRPRGERAHLDLVAAVEASLKQAGVKQENIDVLSHCTACDAENFYSHRRDRGVTGRHLSLVVCRF